MLLLQRALQLEWEVVLQGLAQSYAYFIRSTNHTEAELNVIYFQEILF